MSDTDDPMRSIIDRLVKMRQEDEIRSLSTIVGMVNQASHTVELLCPGVLLRTQPAFETWIGSITDPIERAAVLIHGGVAALHLLRALIEDPCWYRLDLSEILRCNTAAATAAAAKDRDDANPR